MLLMNEDSYVGNLSVLEEILITYYLRLAPSKSFWVSHFPHEKNSKFD